MSQSHKVFALLLTTALAIGFAPPRAIGLPPPLAIIEDPDFTITYSIRESPSTSSPVVMTVELKLAVVGALRGFSDWKITEAVFTRHQASGDTVWRTANPTISTSNGLWRVASAYPALAHFTPPLLTGTAKADNSAIPDLIYDLEGLGNTAAGGAFPTTTSMGYSFQLAQEPPIAEDPEEPVETNGWHPPG